MTTVAALLWCVQPDSRAWAQTSPVALDIVAAADLDRGSQVPHKATGWFDVFGSARLGEGFDLRVRPIVSRQSYDGDWKTQVYELALRYERPGNVGWRVDAGVFPSPVGLSILENRPDVNPVVSQHSTLYLPVPPYTEFPYTYLLAASYPVGAQVTVSGRAWDARAAVTDASPVRGRPFIGENQPPRMTNVMVGAGVTPHIGLRLGAAFATGPYIAKEELRDPSRGDRQATVAQVEAEWSFGYTRLAGEYLWTSRESSFTNTLVHGGWVEATQTFAPRIFGVVRYDDQEISRSVGMGKTIGEDYRRVETAIGYRLTRDLTLRGSFLTRKGYVVTFWDDQVLASVVFSRKLK